MPETMFNVGDRVVYIGCNHACPGYTPGLSSEDYSNMSYGSRGEIVSQDFNLLVVRLADRVGRSFAAHFQLEWEYDALSGR